MKDRLTVFAVSLGLTFGMMVLFINSIEALAIVFVLVTATIIAASTDDLRALGQDRGLLIFAILCAFFTIGVSYYISFVFGDVFLVLLGLDIIALVSYIVMKRMPRYSSSF